MSLLIVVVMVVDRLDGNTSEVRVYLTSTSFASTVVVVVIVEEFIEAALCNFLVPSALLQFRNTRPVGIM